MIERLRKIGVTVLPQHFGRVAVRALPMLWLILFFLVPFLIVLKISFSEALLAMPPYAPLYEWTRDQGLALHVHLANYQFLFTDPLYLDSFLYSIKVAALSTLFCLLLGYPMALAIARASPARRHLLLMLVILPFWTSFLLRVYAWIGLLKQDGLINHILLSLHLIGQSMPMVNMSFAVYVGIVYSYLPFMILPLYATLAEMQGAMGRFVYKYRESFAGLQVGQQGYRLAGTLPFRRCDLVRVAERDSLGSDKGGKPLHVLLRVAGNGGEFRQFFASGAGNVEHVHGTKTKEPFLFAVLLFLGLHLANHWRQNGDALGTLHYLASKLAPRLIACHVRSGRALAHD